MIIEKNIRPAALANGFVPFAKNALELAQFPGLRVETPARTVVDAHVSKVEDHTQLIAIFTDVIICHFRRNARTFAHRHHIVVCQRFAVHFLQEFMHARAVGIHFFDGAAKIAEVCIRKIQSLGNERNHIHAKTVDALIQPEAHELIYFLPNFWVFPVQIGLFFGKQMEVVFAGLLVVFPHIAAEKRLPVIHFFRFPVVKIAVRVIFRLA